VIYTGVHFVVSQSVAAVAGFPVYWADAGFVCGKAAVLRFTIKCDTCVCGIKCISELLIRRHERIPRCMYTGRGR
jgi:hypothetical protein